MENNTRKIWLDSMLHIVTPVLQALEKEELKKTMPLDFHGERAPFAPLEAFGRSMLGLAPWLEAEGLEGEEKELQETYRRLAVRCIDKATDPESADFMIFNEAASPWWIRHSCAMRWYAPPDSWQAACRRECTGIWRRP